MQTLENMSQSEKYLSPTDAVATVFGRLFTVDHPNLAVYPFTVSRWRDKECKVGCTGSAMNRTVRRSAYSMKNMGENGRIRSVP
jgi:hypothetical protein